MYHIKFYGHMVLWSAKMWSLTCVDSRVAIHSHFAASKLFPKEAAACYTFTIHCNLHGVKEAFVF